MLAQIRYVVGIDQRVCTHEGVSMEMSSKYIHVYTQLSENRSFFFYCFYQYCKAAY